MTIVSKGSWLYTLKSRIIVQQLSRWIGSIFQRVGAQLMKARLRLKRMHELDRLRMTVAASKETLRRSYLQDGGIHRRANH
jgi:hypothetical protein